MNKLLAEYDAAIVEYLLTHLRIGFQGHVVWCVEGRGRGGVREIHGGGMKR